MSVSPEEGLHLVDAAEGDDEDDQPAVALSDGAADLETLRDEFVDAFNARDLDTLIGLARPDVECPDIHGDGVGALAEEVSAIWERSPGALLTRGFLDDMPCAVAWLPDEDSCWSRAALVVLDGSDGQLSLVSVPDDADALDRAEADDPEGEEQDEGSNWAEWDSGEATTPKSRDRARP